MSVACVSAYRRSKFALSQLTRTPAHANCSSSLKLLVAVAQGQVLPLLQKVLGFSFSLSVSLFCALSFLQAFQRTQPGINFENDYDVARGRRESLHPKIEPFGLLSQFFFYDKIFSKIWIKGWVFFNTIKKKKL